jgi:hypothetical protein
MCKLCVRQESEFSEGRFEPVVKKISWDHQANKKYFQFPCPNVLRQYYIFIR